MRVVSWLSVVLSRSTGCAMTTSGTFPIGVLNASIAGSNNAIVMRSSFRTISQVSYVIIVLFRNGGVLLYKFQEIDT